MFSKRRAVLGDSEGGFEISVSQGVDYACAPPVIADGSGYALCGKD